jgi:hypothetical protein
MKEARLTGNIARMRQMRNTYRILIINLKGRDRLGNPGLDGRIIIKWILRNKM